ncbi:hypothetical protein WICMUC_004799 [Wickerhamomyces mucosus]|uniref:Thioredoxin domain-containing protein n=1 Tax=Wickerhamomyces mucosus TaxID=1378264 RepID=A0A9P8PFS8_9ASCO|nr:hypothetical protein WICMUC_004799 [Wickerhamomyces mucosus]
MLSRLISKRAFSSSSRRLLQIGEEIPEIALKQNSPGNDVYLSDLVSKGRSIIVGVPGAFSPACSASHVPGYIKHFDDFAAKGINSIHVVGVNDPFVFKAWAESLKGSEKLNFLADPSAVFTQTADLGVDATNIFGGIRSTRYALIVKDGKVEQQFDEPDHFGISVSSAEEVLEKL